MSKAVVTEVPETKATEEKNEADSFVARKAYEEVSNDMHKFKSRFKEAEAEAAKLKADLKAIEDAKLMSEKRYQELYEREKQAREQTELTRKKDRELYLRGLKLSHLKAELGGQIKDAYLAHANIDQIEINDDGTLNSESVRAVANQFRQEHAQLIPQDSASNITSFAPSNSFTSSGKPKTAKDMTQKERIEALARLKNK